MHLCSTHNIEPHDVAFFFDDVLDLSIEEICGLRIMVGNPASPLLQQLAQERKLADYITSADAGHNALREAVELLMGYSGRFDDTILQRVHYSDNYNEYINARNIPRPSFFTNIASKITEQAPQ
jgi:3-deoxy-D-manno-octulosonate 8-phosphate phosphatase (KDO 8-P phosphatase)